VTEYAKLTERPEIIDMVEKMRSGLKVEVPTSTNRNEDEEEHIPLYAQLNALK
jgi:hypothetical protein